MGYIKFDTDWMNDSKIIAFQSLYGRAGLVDVVNLYCAWGESKDGIFDLKNEQKKAVLERFLGKKKKKLYDFLDKCANVEIIDAEAYRKLMLVGCRRSIKDAEARERRRISARDASEAARQKRMRERQEEDGGYLDSTQSVTDTVTDSEADTHSDY